MKKFNKKTLAGLLAVGTIASSVVVFANTEVTANFKEQFSNWAEKKVEIRIGTAEREITAKVTKEEAEIIKEKADILNELETLMNEQLEAGKDITELLEAYETALEVQYDVESQKGEKVLAEFFETKQETLEAFAEAQLNETKAAITETKVQMIENITKELTTQAAQSKKELAENIQTARREFEGEMSAVRKEGQEEVLAYFDAEMEEVYAAIEAADIAAQEEMIAETNRLVEEAKSALYETASKVGK